MSNAAYLLVNLRLSDDDGDRHNSIGGEQRSCQSGPGRGRVPSSRMRGAGGH